MRYREYAPGPWLAASVHCFWTLEGRVRPGDDDFQRAMPDGRPELVFNLADPFERLRPEGIERQPSALLIGPTTRAMRVRPTGRIDLLGVRLAPGGWPRMLGVEGTELLDRALPLADVSRRLGNDLLEMLAEAGSTGIRLGHVEQRLLGAGARDRGGAEPDRRVAAAVGLLRASGGRLPARRLAEATGLGERQLRRLFRAGTGMGPGLLGNLVRFQRVLAELERHAPVLWARLAPRHGYADQAHLCRDFRRFGGISPRRYLAAPREVTRNFVASPDPPG